MSTAADELQPNANTSAVLRSLAERIVRLKGEIKDLQTDVKEVKAEATGQGFDRKALDILVARMMEDESARAARLETEALADVYLAALGMLDGTPLGDAARQRFDPPAATPTEPRESDAQTEVHQDQPPASSVTEAPRGAMSAAAIDDARREGADAASAGVKVLANPYVAGDPRRAAWDEGWCSRSGSDGMELPQAWRRKPKKPDAPGAAQAAG